MSVDNYSKLETYKRIKKRNTGLEQIFAELKFNKKKPKYNYHSGLVAGMLVNDLTIAKPILENGNKKDLDLIQKIFERLVPKARGLVEDYNWNLDDLNNLAEQFFGYDDS